MPGTKDPNSGRLMAVAGPLVLVAMASFKEIPSARNFDSIPSQPMSILLQCIDAPGHRLTWHHQLVEDKAKKEKPFRLAR